MCSVHSQGSLSKLYEQNDGIMTNSGGNEFKDSGFTADLV